MSGQLTLWTATARCQHCDWTDTVRSLEKAKLMRLGSVLLVAHHDMAHPECTDHNFEVDDQGIIA